MKPTWQTADGSVKLFLGDYGVDVHTIYGIKHRRTWSWL